MITIPTLQKERGLWKQGFKAVAGADEVGRGAWAGPVVTCAIVLPADHRQIEGVCDSKMITSKKRQELYHQILDSVSDFGIGLVDNREIDKRGIYQATKQAFLEAINMLSNNLDYLLVDAVSLEVAYPTEAIIKGDQSIYSISCASIIAKVTRDNLMSNLDQRYHVYRFENHKGYGTKEHQALLQEHGPSDIHRLSYRPISRLL